MKATLIVLSIGLFLLAGVVGVIAYFLALSAQNETAALAQAFKEADEDTTPPVEEVTSNGVVEADELLRAYAANPVEADRKYKDKPLILHGQVALVYQDMIEVQPSTPCGLVLFCRVRPELQRDLGGLRPRQEVLLGGTCAGRSGGHVDVVNAQLFRNPPRGR
jgi:hypothetical protein